jgi:hypothetical protein
MVKNNLIPNVIHTFLEQALIVGYVCPKLGNFQHNVKILVKSSFGREFRKLFPKRNPNFDKDISKFEVVVEVLLYIIFSFET